jgi:cell division septum initiation protein DivIVA
MLAEAKRESERILADARDQGEAVIEEARVAARKVEDDARIRRERLREEIRLLEDRIAWAHEGLREVTLRLFPGDADSAEPAESETESA